jgi:hypothetical protein
MIGNCSERRNDMIICGKEKVSVCISSLCKEAAVHGAISMALDDIIFDHDLVN